MSMPNVEVSQPILTIVVPTRDRYEVLDRCLKTFENLDRQDLFELLIFDSSVQPARIDVSNIQVKNVRYVYDKVSGFCATFSRAMDHVNGEYVTIIGDDDAVLPDLLDAAVWAKSRNADSITPLMRAGYIWPGIERQMGRSQDADRLMVQKFTGKLTRLNARKELLHVVSGAFQEFDCLPKIYHGLVRVSRMREVKAQYGDYFIGSSPDISAAVSLACLVTDHYVVDLPLTLPGSSPKSGAGASLSGKHIGKLEQSPLAPFVKDWSRNFPRIYTVQTMWAFSGMYVLEKSNFREMAQFFNPERLLAATVVYNLSAAREIINSESKRRKFQYISLIFYIFFYVLKRLRQLVYRLIRRGQYDLLIDKSHLVDILGAQVYAIHLLADNGYKVFTTRSKL